MTPLYENAEQLRFRILRRNDANRRMQKYNFTIRISFILVTLWACSCKRQNNFTFMQNKKDSARLHTYLDSVYDLQYNYPDSAYQLWQIPAKEAKEKKSTVPCWCIINMRLVTGYCL